MNHFKYLIYSVFSHAANAGYCDRFLWGTKFELNYGREIIAVRSKTQIKRSLSIEQEKALIAALPSQAVCARWMPNLAGTIVGGDWFFGVDTADDLGRHYLNGTAPYDALPDPKSSKWVHQASPRGFNNSGSLYLLDGMTVADGWGHELYYYSEVPYQSYRLWSAGPNGYTFPPWLDVNSFQGKARETIVGWTKDDLGHLATD